MYVVDGCFGNFAKGRFEAISAVNRVSTYLFVEYMYMMFRRHRNEDTLPLNLPARLLQMSREIASEMEYLAKRCFVHRVKRSQEFCLLNLEFGV